MRSFLPRTGALPTAALLRAALLPVAGLTAAALLAGCTAPVAGVAGVAVTEHGTPLGVIVMCHDHVDSAVLHTDDGNGTVPEDPDAPQGRAGSGTTGLWSHDGPVTGFTSWPLIATAGAPPAEGWTADKPVERLEPGRRYTFSGATGDHAWSAARVHFTPEDLARLRPGQVRYADGDEIRTVSVDDFRERACEPPSGVEEHH